MPALIEQLPAGASTQTGVIAFIPTTPAERAASPATGELVIVLGRVKCSYRVEEHRVDYPADWPADATGGRGFVLVKTAEKGSEPTEGNYGVFCVPGETPRCDCRGFARWSDCKHSRAIAVCLAKGWL